MANTGYDLSGGNNYGIGNSFRSDVYGENSYTQDQSIVNPTNSNSSIPQTVTQTKVKTLSEFYSSNKQTSKDISSLAGVVLDWVSEVQYGTSIQIDAQQQVDVEAQGNTQPNQFEETLKFSIQLTGSDCYQRAMNLKKKALNHEQVELILTSSFTFGSFLISEIDIKLGTYSWEGTTDNPNQWQCIPIEIQLQKNNVTVGQTLKNALTNYGQFDTDEVDLLIEGNYYFTKSYTDADGNEVDYDFYVKLVNVTSSGGEITSGTYSISVATEDDNGNPKILKSNIMLRDGMDVFAGMQNQIPFKCTCVKYEVTESTASSGGIVDKNGIYNYKLVFNKNSETAQGV